MKQEIEEELCLQRIALIIATNEQLADKLIEIGYREKFFQACFWAPFLVTYNK